MKKVRSALHIGIIISIILITISIFFNQSSTNASSPIGPVIPTIKFESVVSPVTKRFDSIISKSIDSFKIVGAAIAIVKDGKVELIKPYGLRKANTIDSVDIHTVFRVASVSKGFAGVLGGILNNNNTLSLDDKVINYLPDFKLKTKSVTEKVSLRNLLSQSTGLEAHAYDNLLNQNMSNEYIYKNLYKINICGEPGKYYGYQNVVYSLYDPIVEKKTNCTYGKLLEDSIFKPLSMNDASTGFQSFHENENIAYPHIRTKDQYVSRKLNSKYYNTLPAAGVNASISDMSKWLMALMGNNNDVLNKQTLDTVFTPYVATALKRSYFRYWRGLQSEFYGLGWMVLKYKGNTIIYHRGYVDGYKAEIAFCREKNIGIVYMTNSPDGRTYGWIPTFFDMYL